MLGFSLSRALTLQIINNGTKKKYLSGNGILLWRDNYEKWNEMQQQLKKSK